MFDISSANYKWQHILSSIGVQESYLKKRNGPCPFCGGKDRYRFTDKDGQGMWYCNQCGAGNGMHFVMRFLKIQFKEAIDIVQKVIPERTEKPKPMIDRSISARRIWDNAKIVSVGDPVWAYLKSRGVLPENLSSEIRYCPSMNYYEEGEKLGAFPTMVALIRDSSGKPKTIHVTYLKNGKKAPVASPKKIYSSVGDGVIQLYRPTTELLIAEGIETALAVHRITDKPVWSVISAGGFKSFKCPDDIKKLQIWADNDFNFTGQAAAYELANRLSLKGIDVDVMLPAIKGDDWADQSEFGK